MHRRRRTPSAFTLVELLVVISIVGILVGLLLPAIQQSRVAARGMHCRNNLKQIGLATLSFSETHGALPPARLEPALFPDPQHSCGGEHPSWFARILPFTEQTQLYDRWDVDMPYSFHPEAVVSQPVTQFLCPSRRSAAADAVAPTVTKKVRVSPCGCGGVRTIRNLGGAVGDYAANHGDPSPGAIGGPRDFYLGGNGTGVIISSRARCRAETPTGWIDRIRATDIRDGTSNTLLAGELHVRPEDIKRQPYNGPLFNGEDLAAFARLGGPGVPLARDRNDPPGPVLGFGSWHPGVCNFVLSDGSVRPISNQIDTITLGRLCNREDRFPAPLLP